MQHKNIAILTVENDLHALTVKKNFEDYGNVSCHIIASNRICSSLGISWSNDAASDYECSVPTRDGEFLNVKDIDVIWWRRVRTSQVVPAEITDPHHIDLINNDSRETLLGMFLTKFNGIWVNEPTATTMAENKLVQLKAAQNAGFRVPRTLVSQDPKAIRDFCARLENNIVVKPVRGTQKFHLFTKRLTAEHLASEASIRLSPTIYQEYIPGDQHIRAHCFGDAVYAVLIESEDLDWRQNLDSPSFSVFALSQEVEAQLREVLKILGLRMGVVDLKLMPDQQLVWFEINPQGQYLFAEGLSGVDLTAAFTEFLSEVK